MTAFEVGQCFGEAALLKKTHHEFTIVADGDVTLLVISRESFDSLCGSIAEIQSRTGGVEFCRVPSLLQKLKIPGLHIFSSSRQNNKSNFCTDPAPSDSDEQAPTPIPPRVNRRRRSSICAESINPSDDWVAPTFPHTEEEVARLDGYLSKTVLLSHLDTEARKTSINALEKKEFPKGSERITQVSNLFAR